MVRRLVCVAGAVVVLSVLASGSPAAVQQGGKLAGTGETGITSAENGFGYSVALSADGDTALVGCPADDGGAGAAWVSTRSGGVWTQQGPKLTPNDSFGGAGFGESISLSADGNVALVGGGGEHGYPPDYHSVGAAWVFIRSGGVWNQQGPKLSGSGATGDRQFGSRVATSADGDTALIGGSGTNNYVGAVWVFTHSGSVWSQQGPELTAGASEDGAGQFGSSVALSADGSTALIGGAGDDSQVGAAWAFKRSGGVWSHQGGKLTGSGGVGPAIVFGDSVALSSDGNSALIAGMIDDGYTGAVWPFTRRHGVWSQQGKKLTPTGATPGPFFGVSVSLSSDGATALIGGHHDGGSQSLLLAGAAWVFHRAGATWIQKGPKLTPTGEIGAGFFGYGAALSPDGTTALIGAPADNGGLGAAWAFVKLDVGKPVFSKEALTGVSSRKAKLGFTLSAGHHAPALRSIAITPPTGISFSARRANLTNGLTLTGSQGKRLKFSASVRHGTLSINFSKPMSPVPGHPASARDGCLDGAREQDQAPAGQAPHVLRDLDRHHETQDEADLEVARRVADSARDALAKPCSNQAAMGGCGPAKALRSRNASSAETAAGRSRSRTASPLRSPRVIRSPSCTIGDTGVSRSTTTRSLNSR